MRRIEWLGIEVVYHWYAELKEEKMRERPKESIQTTLEKIDSLKRTKGLEGVSWRNMEKRGTKNIISNILGWRESSYIIGSQESKIPRLGEQKKTIGVRLETGVAANLEANWITL